MKTNIDLKASDITQELEKVATAFAWLFKQFKTRYSIFRYLTSVDADVAMVQASVKELAGMAFDFLKFLFGSLLPASSRRVICRV